MIASELAPKKKYHILMGKRVPVEERDTDHLMRLMIYTSKLCSKYALKHIRTLNAEDGGVWVARCFVKFRKTPRGDKYELAVTDPSPLVAAEKLLTLLEEEKERYENAQTAKQD